MFGTCILPATQGMDERIEKGAEIKTTFGRPNVVPDLNCVGVDEEPSVSGCIHIDEVEFRLPVIQPCPG